MSERVDLNSLSPAALAAAMKGGTSGWGYHGSSAEHVRYAERITGPGGRRKCHCGCGRRSTHTGMCNGVALTFGCELSMAHWVRHGWKRKANHNSNSLTASPDTPQPSAEAPASDPTSIPSLAGKGAAHG